MTDVRDEKDRPVPDVLGILPLRNAVVFPHAVVPLGAGRASSLRLIEEALAGSRLVGAVLQRDASDDAPGAAGLYTVGTVVVIHKAFKQADGTLRLIVQGLERFRIVEIVQESPYLRARIEHIADDGDASPTVEVEALATFGGYMTQEPQLGELNIGIVVCPRLPARRSRWRRMTTKMDGASEIRAAFRNLSSFVRVQMVKDRTLLPRPFAIVFQESQ